MTDVQIMNLSSGTFISLKGVSISNLNLIQELNWDSVDVIGRMNGIKNYKNTTRKKSFEFKSLEDSTSLIYYVKDESSSYSVLNDFKNRSNRIGILTNPATSTYFKSQPLSNFISNSQALQRFFYPSYVEEQNGSAKNYFMQSAPMFYFRMKNQDIESTVYCIIRSFNFEINDFGPNKVINAFNLKFEIEEIAANINQVSSIIKTKTNGNGV